MYDSQRTHETPQSGLGILVRQAMDILIALKTFAGGSDYILPSRYDSDAPMSSATMNRVMDLTYKAAQKEGQSLSKLGRMTYVEQRVHCCMKLDTTRIG